MSKIEWTHRAGTKSEVWNPTTGCDKVSQGCKNCYAEIMHKRLRGMGQKKYQQPFLGHLVMHDDELRKPLKWKNPRTAFVNSMSDLFHESVTFDFIDNVFAVMDCCPESTFIILTKRAERMREYFNENRGWRVGQIKYAYDSSDYDLSSWPLRNVWIGVSVEDQQTADERVPCLAEVDAFVKFISYEPALGPIDFYNYFNDGNLLKTISWVIMGGESGHKARPMHPDWARSTRDQCNNAGVPFFFKQWGAWDDNATNPKAKRQSVVHNGIGYEMVNNGKKNTGNLLDGKQHLEFPIS